jgi:hypothetical protein
MAGALSEALGYFVVLEYYDEVKLSEWPSRDLLNQKAARSILTLLFGLLFLIIFGARRIAEKFLSTNQFLSYSYLAAMSNFGIFYVAVAG